MKRRQFLKSSAYAASLPLVGAALLKGPMAHAKSHQAQFSRPFVVPPLDLGKRDGNNVHFDLAIASGESNFIGTKTTQTLGINGDYLGPVLRAKRGDRISFAVKNQLKQTTTLHWHGFVLPAEMDGGPHQEIKPGETWRPAFDVIQAASTYWYHSHQHKKTGEQVYHGLAGLFIIDDDISLNSGLPLDYGVEDIPVIIQDRKFNQNGSFQYLGSMPDRMRGMHGDTVLVNGVVTPTLKAEKTLLRLRLLNGSNARFYNLAFHDDRPFAVIAADGGFLPAPINTASIQLAPGERAEILLDLSNGQDAVLLTRSNQRNSSGGMMGGMMSQMMSGGSEELSIMKIQAPGAIQENRFSIPPNMLPLPDWQSAKPSHKRHFQLEMQMGPRMMMSSMLGGSPMSISGKSMDMNVVNHRVKPNSIELWEISNTSMLPHPFHIHNTQFIVAAKSSGRLSATETGLKDTIVINPQEKVRLLVPFPEYSNSTIPYMYHCHILEHEDAGMMGQFTVEA